MADKDEKQYSDFSNVRNIDNQLIPEEFPEGSFGSPINAKDPVISKSTPWEEGQYRESAFVYPYKELHAGLPRQTPGAHPLHDEASAEEEEQ